MIILAILTNIWKNTNYKVNIPYIISMYMREYDISKANITSLYSQKLISEDYYHYLCTIDKQSREILIGNMQRDIDGLYNKVQDGIIDAKRQLFDSNSILESEVLSIRNDSVTVLNRELEHTIFGLYEFKMKGLFTSYFKLANIDFYYYNSISGEESVEIKGIKDKFIPLHIDGILDIICTTAYMLQNDTIQNTIQYISNMYDQYINRKLPVEYYREFDHVSKYRFRTMYFDYSLDNITEKELPYININRNLLILRELSSIVTDIYVNKCR